ncbi:Bug family tripartite tricarboxylate transporter substrate binding protein [Siccirubricoccus phaeus]|uniref:Bug family tripartite tricarboxylate transporter substrate binding protein n=1 Tax=Siccirubricoccus phaeus TaxID=2595053 RepID=UPI0011F1BA80|nr:tripartite tricarboxylate transporter substrate binding protein [Siccirubricoccus phaeus]
MPSKIARPPGAGRRGLLAAAGLAALARPALAQQGFPDRPVRFVVPSSAGSGVDLLTRVLADCMARQSGRAFLVDNRPGAASAIGTQHVARQPADGYTLLYGGPNITILQVMNSSFAREIDVRTAFAPITIAASGPYVFVVNNELPVRTVPELIAWLHANPGRGNYATTGIGATMHLMSELFRQLAGNPAVTMVPYRSDGPAVQAVASGEVQYAIAVSGTAKPLVDSGLVRALAVTGPRRMAGLPEVPTITEVGVITEFDIVAWLGYFAPAGTPPERVAWVQRAIALALYDEGVQARLADLGFAPVGSEPAALRAVVERDVALWTRVAKAAGLSPL